MSLVTAPLGYCVCEPLLLPRSLAAQRRKGKAESCSCSQHGTDT